mgnify:CR=1 FL=1
MIVLRWWGTMLEYLSVSKISEVTGIPESTIRRYMQNFVEFLNYKEIGRGRKYSSETVEIVETIYELYNKHYETPEVKGVIISKIRSNRPK